MKIILPFLLIFLIGHKADSQKNFSLDSSAIAGFYAEILANGKSYEDLRFLCKSIGHRLAGSESAAKAISWGFETLKACNPDTVFLMPVEVPHWTRGKDEGGYYTSHNSREELSLTALGGSVGSNGNITASIVEVKGLEELKSLGTEKIKGKIVFFNKALDQYWRCLRWSLSDKG
jgi:carboxypeptidase Q